MLFAVATSRTRDLPLGHPRQQSPEHAVRCAAIALAGREAFLDLVEPQHARGHDLGSLQGFAQIALGLTVVLVV